MTVGGYQRLDHNWGWDLEEPTRALRAGFGLYGRTAVRPYEVRLFLL